MGSNRNRIEDSFSSPKPSTATLDSTPTSDHRILQESTSFLTLVILMVKQMFYSRTSGYSDSLFISGTLLLLLGLCVCLLAICFTIQTQETQLVTGLLGLGSISVGFLMLSIRLMIAKSELWSKLGMKKVKLKKHVQNPALFTVASSAMSTTIFIGVHYSKGREMPFQVPREKPISGMTRFARLASKILGINRVCLGGSVEKKRPSLEQIVWTEYLTNKVKSKKKLSESGWRRDVKSGLKDSCSRSFGLETSSVDRHGLSDSLSEELSSSTLTKDSLELLDGVTMILNQVSPSLR